MKGRSVGLVERSSVKRLSTALMKAYGLDRDVIKGVLLFICPTTASRRDA